MTGIRQGSSCTLTFPDGCDHNGDATLIISLFVYTAEPDGRQETLIFKRDAFVDV